MKRLQLPSEKQFQEFCDQLVVDAPGWKLETTKKENNTRVFSKEVEGTAVKTFRVSDPNFFFEPFYPSWVLLSSLPMRTQIFSDLKTPVSSLYDLFHDTQYRGVWDEVGSVDIKLHEGGRLRPVLLLIVLLPYP